MIQEYLLRVHLKAQKHVSNSDHFEVKVRSLHELRYLEQVRFCVMIVLVLILRGGVEEHQKCQRLSDAQVTLDRNFAAAIEPTLLCLVPKIKYKLKIKKIRINKRSKTKYPTCAFYTRR